MRYIKNEWRKNWGIVSLIIVILLIIGGNALFAYIDNGIRIDNWQQKAKEVREEYQQQLKDSDNEDSKIPEKIKEAYQKEILKIDYALENNVPYGVTTAWDFVTNVSSMMAFILILLIVMTAKVFTVEYESNTWKNIFATGAKKSNVFGMKVVYCFLQAFLCMLALFITSYIVGMIKYGMPDSIYYLEVINNKVSKSSQLLSVVKSYWIMIWNVVFYVSLVILLAVVIKDKKLPNTIGIALFVLGSLINELFIKIKIDQFMPFNYLNAELADFSENAVKGPLVIGIYSVVFIAIATYVFRRREITT